MQILMSEIQARLSRGVKRKLKNAMGLWVCVRERKNVRSLESLCERA